MMSFFICVGWMRDRLTTGHMAWINRISDAIITTFGTFALLTLRK
jgi:hypothetical protein